MPDKNGTVHQIGEDLYEVGEQYDADGVHLAYRGILQESPVPSPGLYWDSEAGEFIVVPAGPGGQPLGAPEDPVDRGTFRQMSPGDADDRDRQPNGDVLRFAESEEDDDIVKKLKAIINGRSLTLRGVMDAGFDYNLVYGLRTRHSIKLASLEKWAKLLRMKIEFELVPLARE